MAKIMSGTDHSVEIEPNLQPQIILVRPQMGENIGAAARAMWNFGLERMTLVAPRDGWPNPAATAMASGAARVLDQVQVKPSLDEACGHLNYVFATTARSRDLTKEVLSPKEAMGRLHQLNSGGQKTGMLFGPERAGLENEDLVHADALIRVPVNPSFGSLNLAQCVLLLAYEWQLCELDEDTSQMEWASAEPATQIERQHLQKSLEEKLDAVGFFWPDDKAENMKLNLRNMFSRMPLSDIDIRTFHGIFRALERGRNRKDDQQG